MNCVIIEDQLPAQRVIKKYLTELPSIELVAAFQSALEALEFLNSNRVDLIFLDINLPKISGISFLKNLHNPPKVIITSAYSQYALEGFELDVVDYLLKPFSFDRFLKAISKLKHDDQANSGMLFIKSDKEFFQIKVDDIQYIRGDDDFTRVYTEAKFYVDKRTLKNWMRELPSSFLRIHKSFIINTKAITRIAGQRVFLGAQEIPIGRTYKEVVAKLTE